MESVANKSQQKFNLTKVRVGKRDFSIVPMLAVALVIALIAVAPLVWTIKLNYDYRHYMRELRDDFIKGERFDTIEAIYDGEQYHLDKIHASEIFTTLSIAGMGRVCEPMDIPEEEGAVIDLGHGTTLFLARTVMTIEYDEEVPGLYVEYTFDDGKKYCYETDATQFYRIRIVFEDIEV